MKELLDFIESSPEGVSEDDISTKFPIYPKHELAKHLNTLLKSNKIIITPSANLLIYKKATNLVDEERILHQLIADSNGKGLWLRDLKMKSNISQNVLVKILKNMEGKCIIKAIKSVKGNRKVYILYDDVPNEELTGGIWFNDGNVDVEFVEQIMKIVNEYLWSLGNCDNLTDMLVSLESLLNFVVNSNVSTVRINLNEFETLVRVMCYDGMVKEIYMDDVAYYMADRSYGKE